MTDSHRRMEIHKEKDWQQTNGKTDTQTQNANIMPPSERSELGV